MVGEAEGIAKTIVRERLSVSSRVRRGFSTPVGLSDCRIYLKLTTSKKLSRIAFDRFAIDPTSLEVTLNDIIVKLKTLEFNILHLLANYPDRAWSRQQIIEKIWGWNCNNPGDEQIVSVHIAQIRKKLSQVDAAAAQLIKTVRNYGYRFDRPPICENTLNQNVS